MKKAIQFGAGNIGRGFIGAVLSQAGYEVVFADVVPEVIERINNQKKYTVHITDVNSYDIEISNIKAVNSNGEDVVKEIVSAGIITTAVGLRILQFVAPAIAKGIVARRSAGVKEPLNIIACENGLRASSQLRDLVYGKLEGEDLEWAKKNVGFIDCSVDRIVPPVHCDNPLDVAVEEFYEWNVETESFVGTAPKIAGMNLAHNLEAYIERKLFTLNTGHATTAYLGSLKGYETIGESIADPEIYAVVKAVMQQSGDGLIKKFGFDHDAHYAYIEKILHRFENPFLRDECTRVGREPLRKLSPNDRLILPMMTAKGFGLPYDKILFAVGAALHYNNPADPQSVEMLQSIASDGLDATIVKYTGIQHGDSLIEEIVKAYNKLAK